MYVYVCRCLDTGLALLDEYLLQTRSAIQAKPTPNPPKLVSYLIPFPSHPLPHFPALSLSLSLFLFSFSLTSPSSHSLPCPSGTSPYPPSFPPSGSQPKKSQTAPTPPPPGSSPPPKSSWSCPCPAPPNSPPSAPPSALPAAHRPAAAPARARHDQSAVSPRRKSGGERSVPGPCRLFRRGCSHRRLLRRGVGAGGGNRHHHHLRHWTGWSCWDWNETANGYSSRTRRPTHPCSPRALPASSRRARPILPT